MSSTGVSLSGRLGASRLQLITGGLLTAAAGAAYVVFMWDFDGGGWTIGLRDNSPLWSSFGSIPESVGVLLSMALWFLWPHAIALVLVLLVRPGRTRSVLMLGAAVFFVAVEVGLLARYVCSGYSDQALISFITPPLLGSVVVAAR